MSLNHEKVLRLLHQNASAVLDTHDEPLAIMFAVAWQPGLGDDLPFGTAVFRQEEGQSIRPEILLSCLRQTSKLGAHLVGNMGGWTKSLQANVGQLHKLQGEVDDLKKRLSKYETIEAPQAAGPTQDRNHPGNVAQLRGGK